MGANDLNKEQVGGDHYKTRGAVSLHEINEYAKKLGIDSIQHWDLAVLFGWDPYQYQITKYVMRWKDKDGAKDLKKGLHFHQKYVAIAEADALPSKWAIAEAPTYDGRIEKRYGRVGDQEWVATRSRTDAITRMEEPRLYPNVDPLSGWVNAQFEGSDANGSLWRCRRCHESFRSPVHACPDDYHPCRLEGNDTGVAGPKYTNQG
jgi:hypothetical protein